MAAHFAASTPSPPPRVRTPQTPKHGYSDHWEPFSPRKSARISSQRERANNNRNRTPSPKPSASRNASSKPANDIFGTPAVSPQKKRAPAMDSVRRAPRLPGVARAAESLGLPPTSQPTSAARASGMLPTPVKTPSDRKKRDEKIEAGVRAAARNLFHDDSDGLSSPRKKKTKKYTGLSLDSFNAEVVDEPIQIFTDSRDRLPEVDESAENPFYGETVATTPQPPTRRSPRRKMVIVPGEGRIPMEEAVQREDGIVYVFRGKTFWKPNGLGNAADQLDVDGELSGDILDTLGNDLEPRRVTRSAIKPRLLFARERKAKEAVVEHNTEDEEAATDIEEHALPSIVIDSGEKTVETTVETPAEEQDTPDTPTAPRFAPASPPSTTRTTRTTKKLEGSASPLKKPTKSRSSPFDSWRRSKSHAGSRGQKREAESQPVTSAPKRQRA